jgi:hypothetical protein
MRSIARTVIIAAALALPAGGCVNFDPVDMFAGDWFSTKKPLPGERKPLFPEGVPGVSKGVPPDLMKGNQAAALQDQQAEVPAARLPEEPKPKPKARPKPKPKPVQQAAEPERRPTSVTVRPSQPPPQQQQQPSQQMQWPDPPGQSRPAGGGGVQWPDPPATR